MQNRRSLTSRPRTIHHCREFLRRSFDLLARSEPDFWLHRGDRSISLIFSSRSKVHSFFVDPDRGLFNLAWWALCYHSHLIPPLTHHLIAVTPSFPASYPGRITISPSLPHLVPRCLRLVPSFPWRCVFHFPFKESHCVNSIAQRYTPSPLPQIHPQPPLQPPNPLLERPPSTPLKLRIILQHLPPHPPNQQILLLRPNSHQVLDYLPFQTGARGGGAKQEECAVYGGGVEGAGRGAEGGA